MQQRSWAVSACRLPSARSSTEGAGAPIQERAVPIYPGGQRRTRCPSHLQNRMPVHSAGCLCMNLQNVGSEAVVRRTVAEVLARLVELGGQSKYYHEWGSPTSAFDGDNGARHVDYILGRRDSDLRLNGAQLR